MLGDQRAAPANSSTSCKKYGAYVLVDEAHSLGALGEDRPRALRNRPACSTTAHFIVGTFSKTLGAIGGYCVSDGPDFDILRVTCAPTCSPPRCRPRSSASVRQALRVVKARPGAATQLWDNVATLYDGLSRPGLQLGPEHGPVVGVHLPDRR